MTNLDRRLYEIGMKILNEENIDGAHAGNIVRVDVQDKDYQKFSYIYKEFLTDRNNEVEIYTNLKDSIMAFNKVVKVWSTSPQAILMYDFKSPLKNAFENLPKEDKRILIEKILGRFLEIHSINHSQNTFELPIHQITSEWYEWCLDQLNKLCSRNQWADTDWIETLHYSYKQLDLVNYNPRSPLVLTHGDPHLDNIFYHEDQVWFIDWEWTAIGTPLRDITIMLQDIYDSELIQYVKNLYRIILNNSKFNLNTEDYSHDFHYMYIDHTAMMLAWEIEKYFQGYTSEEKIQKIIAFKIEEIKRTTNEELKIINKRVR
ncbi:phosphotransferase family protein [Bacillus salitolerans]|uniref:Phosphotransferase family protein n=1 Tax=Bacillus salitolerans TaxID=1437434 RepID=A0ABW4LNI5_9BACI